VLRFKEQETAFDGINIDVDYLRSYRIGTLDVPSASGYTSSIHERNYGAWPRGGLPGSGPHRPQRPGGGCSSIPPCVVEWAVQASWR